MNDMYHMEELFCGRKLLRILLTWILLTWMLDVKYQIVLVPDPLHGEEEGAGHELTIKLAPGRNVDLTNQNLGSK